MLQHENTVSGKVMKKIVISIASIIIIGTIIYFLIEIYNNNKFFDIKTINIKNKISSPIKIPVLTKLYNGKILILRKYKENNCKNVDLYDPNANKFVPAPMTHSCRNKFTTTTLKDGKILIVGGSQNVNYAEVYDPTKNIFYKTEKMLIPREGHTATLLPDGRVLIVGGYRYKGNSTENILLSEIYDPIKNIFYQTGKMIAPREGHISTLLQNGKVLITGGGRQGHVFKGFNSLLPNGDFKGKSLESFAEIYDIKTGHFSKLSDFKDLSWPYYHTVVVLNNKKILIIGAEHNKHNTNIILTIYDPITSKFNKIKNTKLNGILYNNYFSVILLSNQKLLIICTNDDVSDSFAILYNALTGDIKNIKGFVKPRMAYSYLTLEDGSILIAGGQVNNGFLVMAPTDITNKLEIFDIKVERFVMAGKMRTARVAPSLVQLQNGNVLIIGGTNQEGYQSNAEVY